MLLQCPIFAGHRDENCKKPFGSNVQYFPKLGISPCDDQNTDSP